MKPTCGEIWKPADRNYRLRCVLPAGHEGGHCTPWSDPRIPVEGGRNAPRRRTPKCRGCRRRLDSAEDAKCKACGWLLCTCGACGCGYRRPILDG